MIMNSRTICLEGTACVGKTRLTSYIKEHNLADTVYNDYNELCIREPKYKIKDSDIEINKVFNLDIFIHCMNTHPKNFMVTDRSPLSSLFYTQINHLVVNSSIQSLKADCRLKLDVLFSRIGDADIKHIHIVIWQLLKHFKIMIFNTSNIELTANNLLKRNTDTDRLVAHNVGRHFNYEYCKWYTIVQSCYFKTMHEEYQADIMYYEVNNNFEDTVKFFKTNFKELEKETKSDSELQNMLNYTDTKKQKKPKETTTIKNSNEIPDPNIFGPTDGHYRYTHIHKHYHHHIEAK